MLMVDEGHVHLAFGRDVPAARYRATDSAFASLPARSSVSADGPGARGVLELYRAVSGHPQRALVGGTLTWEREARSTMHLLLVDPAPGDPERRSCPGAFGHNLVPGLPVEFAGAVLTAGVGRLRSAGALTVDRAAYDPVESSEVAFELATALLLEVLRLPGADDEAIAQALRTATRRLT